MPILALLAGLAFAPADTVRVVVVATTDIQGQITDWDYLQNGPSAGGLARAATAIDSLRVAFPGQVVLVDAGGALSGSPFAAYYGREGSRDLHPIVDAMNLLRYDAVTPGDEDFDFGAARFNRAVAGADFRWVSGNLRVLPEDTLALASFVVIKRGDVRIAIAGFTTPLVMITNGVRLRGHFRVERIEPAIEEVLRGMRDNADVAIVLSHSGLDGISSYDTTGVGGENVAAVFAAGRVRPDLVVVGHSRQEIRDSTIAGVHFVAPLPGAASLAVVHLTLVEEGGSYRLVGVRSDRVALAGEVPATRLLRRLAEPHATLLRWASTIIAEARGQFALAAARVADTPLMGLVHDALRRTTGADLDAIPAVDLRAVLGPGEVTANQVYRVYPYEYGLRAVRISGEQLRAYLEQAARYFFVDSAGRVFPNRYVPGDQYDLIGGASYQIDLQKPMGTRITGLMVHNRAVLANDTFTMAVSDNRQQGQGNYGIARAPVVWDRGVTVREALATELVRRKILRPDDVQADSFALAPPDLAARARALFVRETGPEPVAEAAPPPSVALPVTLTRAERRTQDSLERIRARSDSIASFVVATLRLPAERGPDGGLVRLLADAYRNEANADVAIVLPAEATASLPARRLTAPDVRAAASGDATLLTIRMSGSDLNGLLENAVAHESPCCEFSGLLVEYDPQARPWDRVKRTELASTGKPIDRKAVYVVAFSTALVSGDDFPLGATDCAPTAGCRKPGMLSRWGPQHIPRLSSEVLLDYLRHLPQPVTPPDDRRLRPGRG